MGGEVGSSLTLHLCWPKPRTTPSAAGEGGEVHRGSERGGGAGAWSSRGLLAACFASILSFNLPHVVPHSGPGLAGAEAVRVAPRATNLAAAQLCSS